MTAMDRDLILNAVNEGKYTEAKSMISDEISDAENDNELLRLLGLCNINLGCFDEAYEIFKKLSDEDETDALSLYYCATILITNKKYREAKEYLEKVITLREDYVDAYKSLAIVNIKLGEAKSVFDFADKMESLAPGDIKVIEILASAAIKESKKDLAVKYLTKAVELNPEEAKYNNKLGMVYFGCGNIDDAIAQYTKATEKDALQAEYYCNRGLAYFSKGETEKALADLEKAYNEDKKGKYLSSWAMVALKIGDFKKAAELYEELIKLPGEDNETNQYNLVCAYDGAIELDKAIKILEKLLTFNLDSVQLKLHLASLYSRTKKTEPAKILYADLMASGVVNTGIMYEYAVLCAKTFETDKAEAMLKKIIVTNPDFVAAYKDLAIIYTARKNFELAEEYFKKAYKCNPENASVLFEYANYFHLMADFENAKKFYLKLLKKEKLPTYMLADIAKNYISMNMISRAKSVLLRAIKQDVKNVNILFLLGQVYFKEENYENAKQFLEDAYNVKPDYENSYMLAKTYMKTGDLNSAFALLNVLNLSYRGNTRIMMTLAECSFLMKDYKSAKQELNDLLKMIPDSEEAAELLAKIEEKEKEVE